MIARAGQQGPQPPADGLPEAMVHMDSLDIEPIGRAHRFRGHGSHRVESCAPQTREYIDWRWPLSWLYIEITHDPLLFSVAQGIF